MPAARSARARFSIRSRKCITPDKKSAGLRFGKQRHIVCPWHGYEFDLATGCHPGDASVRLTPVPVAVRDGQIYVSVPEWQQRRIIFAGVDVKDDRQSRSQCRRSATSGGGGGTGSERCSIVKAASSKTVSPEPFTTRDERCVPCGRAQS